MRIAQRMWIGLFCLASVVAAFGQADHNHPGNPRVVVIGVNGAEWDIIRPLVLKGEMPHLAAMMENGVSGKLQTTSDPNCPKVYSSIFTSTLDVEHGITGFEVNGVPARSDFLKGLLSGLHCQKRGSRWVWQTCPARFRSVLLTAIWSAECSHKVRTVMESYAPRSFPKLLTVSLYTQRR